MIYPAEYHQPPSPARVAEIRRKEFPSLKKDARLLFSLFDPTRKGYLPADERVSPQIAALMKDFKMYGNNDMLYRVDDHGHWEYGEIRIHPKTNRSSSHAPFLRPQDIGHAEEAMILTFGHHLLGWGPRMSLLFSRTGNKIQPWMYTKGGSESSNTKPVPISEWIGTPAEALLYEAPEEDYHTGVDISYWIQDESIHNDTAGYYKRHGNHYIGHSGFKVVGIQLAQFIREMRTLQKNDRK